MSTNFSQTITLGLLAFCTALGCTTPNTESFQITAENQVTIQANWFDTNLDKLSKFDVEYHPFETSDQSLIGYIDDFKLDDDRIFVLDKHVAKSLLIFNQSGDFISKIERSGHGPNEVDNFNCFTLNRKRKEIIVSDLGLRKLLVFNYQGELIREVTNPHWFSRMEWLREDTYLYYLTHYNVSEKSSQYENKGPLIIIADEKGKVSNERFFIEDKPSMYTIVESFSLSHNSDDILFTKALDPSIYAIGEDDGVVKKVNIDLGKYAFPDTYLDLPVKNFRDYTARNNYSQVFEVASTKEHYALTFENPVKMPGLKVLIQAIWPKNFSQSATYYLPTNLPDKRGVMLPQIKEAHGEYFFGLFDAEEILQANENSNDKIFSSFSNEKLVELKETDNPVLVKIRINEEAL